MPKQKHIRHINLFSCFGGLPFGLESTNQNIKTLMLFDPNAECQAILEHYWDCPVVGTTPDAEEEVIKHAKEEPIDALTARYREEHDWEFIRHCIQISQPKIVVIETMASLRSRGLGRVLQDLWALNYDAEGHVIPAATFNAPYRGERYWIVAYPNTDGCETGGDSSPDEGELGKQFLTNDLVNEYRVWLDGQSASSERSVLDKPRLLRRDDSVSRRVDAARVRFLSDDASPVVSGFIGFALSRILRGEYLPLPSAMMSATHYVRNIEKKSNLTRNTQKLRDAGIPFVSHCDGMHLVITTPNNATIDFWPTTAAYVVRRMKIHGYGVEHVISGYGQY